MTSNSQTAEISSEAPAETTDSSRIDRWGTFASAACALHCLTFSLLPGAISALGLGVFFGPSLEWALASAAFLIAGIALFIGWRRHRSPVVVATFVLGGLALVVSRALEEMGVEGFGLPVGLLAAALLITGHVLNTRHSRALTGQ